VETFTSGTDEDDAEGTAEDGVGEELDVTVDKVEGVGIADAVELAEVDVTGTTITFVDELDDFVDVEDGPKDDFVDVGTEGVQLPKPAWQPVPQYAEDEPQRPLLEQQFPNIEYLQVRRFQDCTPQRPVTLGTRASAPRNGRAVMANRAAERIVIEDGLNE
jgi:hypothetical protein